MKLKSVVQSCPCEIKDFIVKCSHGRQASKEGILEVVADTTRRIEAEARFGSDKANIAIVRTIEHSGTDSVSATLVCDGGCEPGIAYSGGHMVACKKTPGKQASEVLEVAPYVPHKGSLGKVAPLSYAVQGCTSGGARSVAVHQYPSEQHEFKIKADTLGFIVGELNDAMKAWGKACLGWSPVEVVPEFTAPVGSVSASNGWKEDEDSWRVYYEVSLMAALDPLFGFKIAINVSLVQCAAASVGIPPCLTKFIDDYALEILIIAELDIECRLQGSVAVKRFTDGKRKVSGKLAFVVEGTFSLGLAAKVGSDYICSVGVIGKGSIAIENENELTVTEEKIAFTPGLKLKPLEFIVEVKTVGFLVKDTTMSNSWKIWEKEKNEWKGDERVLLDLSEVESSH
ncbi:MAG: hypothetical protein V4857_11690 [Pseudomonadota bacterium]